MDYEFEQRKDTLNYVEEYEEIVDLAEKFNDPKLKQDYIDKLHEEAFWEEEKQRISQALVNEDNPDHERYNVISYLSEFEGRHTLYYAKGKWRQDKYVVMLAVKGGCSLEHVSEELRDDEEVLLTALAKTIDVDDLQYVSERLRDNEEFLTKAMNVMQGSFLRYLLEESANIDRKQRPFLPHFSERLRDNKEFLMKVINMTQGPFLRYVSEKLRDDEEIVLEAIRKGGILELANASERLRENKKFFEKAVHITQDFFANHIIPDGLLTGNRTQRETILEITRNNFIHVIPKKLLKNKNYMMGIAMKNFHNLRYFPLELRNDKGFMISLIKEYPHAIKYASNPLKRYIKAVLDIRRFL